MPARNTHGVRDTGGRGVSVKELEWLEIGGADRVFGRESLLKQILGDRLNCALRVPCSRFCQCFAAGLGGRPVGFGAGWYSLMGEGAACDVAEFEGLIEESVGE